MTNAISSFAQVVPAVPSAAPVISGEAAALAFFAMVDTAKMKDVADLPNLGKSGADPNAFPKLPEMPVPGADQATSDETMPLLFADVVPQITALVMPHAACGPMIVQSDMGSDGISADVQSMLQIPPALAEEFQLTSSVDGLPGDLTPAAAPLLEHVQRQAPQTQVAINDSWSPAPRPSGIRDTGQAGFGYAPDVQGSLPLALAEPKPGSTEFLRVDEKDASASEHVQTKFGTPAPVHTAPVQESLLDPPAELPETKEGVARTDILPDQPTTANRPAMPSHSMLTDRLVMPMAFAISDHQIAAKTALVELGKISMIEQSDRLASKSGAVPLALAAVVMRQTSDTALFGFQMRVRDSAEGFANPVVDNKVMAPVAVSAQPQVPNDAMLIVGAPSPTESAAESLVQLTDDNGPAALNTGATPFAEIPQQHAQIVQTSRFDTVLPAAAVVGLRELPQAVTSALLADPAHPVTLQLDPIELGTVAFNMDTGPAGLVVTIIAERPETLELLRRYADQFLADLRQSGFQGASLNFGQSGDSGPGNHRQERAQVQSGNPLPSGTSHFESAIQKPQPIAGSGLDLRL